MLAISLCMVLQVKLHFRYDYWYNQLSLVFYKKDSVADFVTGLKNSKVIGL